MYDISLYSWNNLEFYCNYFHIILSVTFLLDKFFFPLDPLILASVSSSMVVFCRQPNKGLDNCIWIFKMPLCNLNKAGNIKSVLWPPNYIFVCCFASVTRQLLLHITSFFLPCTCCQLHSFPYIWYRLILCLPKGRSHSFHLFTFLKGYIYIFIFSERNICILLPP